MRQTHKKLKAAPIFLAALLSFSVVGANDFLSKDNLTVLDIATAETVNTVAAENTGVISNYEDDFEVSYNQTAPIVNETYGGAYGGHTFYSWQNRKVQLDSGKRGIKVTSKASGSDVNGKSFMIGGTMSGKFDIDFRIPSAETFQYDWVNDDGYNRHADVQQVMFTFTDVATGKYFNVNIDASTIWPTYKERNITSMWVSGYGSATSSNSRCYSTHYTYADTSDYTSQETGTFYTNGNVAQLYGTSFANATELGANAGGFTAGSKSTAFSFDPSDGWIRANRYYRDGTLGEGDYADEQLNTYNNPSGDYTYYVPATENQLLDGRNVVLSENDEICDVTYYGEWEAPWSNDAGGLPTFENYTVKVTIAEMTPNDTAVSVNGESKTYDRYANMYIYSLNGKSLATADYNTTRGGISYNSAEFDVSLNQTAPVVNDTYGAAYTATSDERTGGALYTATGKKVQLDEGKLGLKITSKATGSDVNGQSFMLGGTMSGKFDIDFRIPSKQTIERDNNDWSSFNGYADVQQIVFTFTDVDTGLDFDVTIDASSTQAAVAKKNIPEIYVSRFNEKTLKYAMDYEYNTSGDYTSGEKYISGSDTWGSQHTRLYGTSFANAAEVYLAGGFTEGSKSTEFSFDPTDFMLKANRYLLNSTFTSDTNGNDLALNDKLDVLDVDHYGQWNGWGGQLPTFENYTVKVTFAEMTPNNTKVKVNGTDKVYNRHANMYIYSLNGESMTTDLFTARSTEEKTYNIEGLDRDCVVSWATVNANEYSFGDFEEYGVIVREQGATQAYKFAFNKEHKLIDNQFGMAIYGLQEGKTYEFVNYVIYKGVRILDEVSTHTVTIKGE